MKPLITIIFVIVFILEFKAQHFTHDIGVFVGTSSLQADYGQRGNFASEWNNNGISYSVAHYLSFYNRTLRWDPNNVLHNHLMVKTELQYLSNVKLEHHGKWAKGSSYGAEQLRAMNGTLRMLNLGLHLEYYYRPLEEFVYPHSHMWFNPYFTFGIKYSSFTNGLQSNLGDWTQDISVLPKKYTSNKALDVGSGNAFSLALGLGTRFKLAPKIDLVAQFNYQYFFSDKIDGLQAKVIENKNNEWLVNIQFGIVYHLNFNTPLFY
ncbi:THC0290_0291 family protein [Polaribacter septentrionalilitoris]|uniref:THC0290_0291 family protein n=1 Tax=Polaribacter septentrionalilitoris TaxID=2494657 RepID=UPI001358D0D6|nr:outer membrane beta-barrel protein [Polaribacter septentrionalilitoris]